MKRQDTKLSINLNKVALLRNQRHVGYPDPVLAGRTVLEAGAHGLTVHPRPDERHIRKTDVTALAALAREDRWKAKGVEFNIEGNPFDDYLSIVDRTRPDQATLVPDSPDAATSDNGWDVFAEEGRLRQVIATLKGLGCRVSLFMNATDDPEPAMRKAANLGADRVELYTGPYADAFSTRDRDAVLARYVKTAEAAVAAGLLINAGHDLTTENLPALVRALPRLDEVSIGHAFTSDALWMGLDGAVKAYLDALRPAAGASSEAA
ncbi:pyridoxine 5'-phosphate synthase [Rhodospirillaceae bacterium KN72]|uniref:Pyridoxine 5'-phosphate synthase n=1 Tax=Pacificispira spongiicola TaxID=2729598 RepID=A0A7Y0E1C5_9PROT|nr:pyridoxine 5'-phosphate synthase [Pacificispira spongiicola]NMM44626.1 pyridoxine 5'-phosphate synthase [Pacificispira spongiicola]